MAPDEASVRLMLGAAARAAEDRGWTTRATVRLFWMVLVQAAALAAIARVASPASHYVSHTVRPAAFVDTFHLQPGPNVEPPFHSFHIFDPFAAVGLRRDEEDDPDDGEFSLPDFFEHARATLMRVPEPLESEIVEEVADIPSGIDTSSPITNAQEFRLNSFAGFVATMVSAAITFPIDTLKTRLQAGKNGIPRRRGVRGLYKGLIPSMLVFCPTVSVFVGLTYWLRAQLLAVELVARSPNLQWAMGLLAGALSNLLLSFYRVPTSMMIKLIQTGICPDVRSSLKQIFWTAGCWQKLFTIWVVVLFKDIPNGALRIGIYQFYQECLGFLGAFGFSSVTQRTLSGIVAGMTLGVIANPIDLVVTRAMTDVHSSARDPKAEGVEAEADPLPNPLKLVRDICSQIYGTSGLGGFFAGAMVRALARIPSTCIWFATFDIMKGVLLRRWH
eukprot:EG_transcript_8515